jgi:hypothetical protein
MASFVPPLVKNNEPYDSGTPDMSAHAQEQQLTSAVPSPYATGPAAHGQEAWAIRSDAVLDELLNEYRKSRSPIPIDIRGDVNWVGLGERLSHGIHSYPARVIRHIPILFLNANRYSAPNDLIVDPFCGSGTVLLEAAASNRRILGADSNPLARLISQVKVTPIAAAALADGVERIVTGLPDRTPDPPKVVNIDYWFIKAVREQLAGLSVAVANEEDPGVRDFLRVCLSGTVRRASLADPRISVPVRLRRDQYPVNHRLNARMNALIDTADTHDAVATFISIANGNIKRIESLSSNNIKPQGLVVPSADARSIRSPSGRRLPAGSVKLVLTSPPYLGAQKYIRASSLSLGWLGLTETHTLRDLEDLTIGREHFRKVDIGLRKTGVDPADELIRQVQIENPLRAHIASTYLCEMRDALQEIHRILARDGVFVMVSGSNRLCGRPFHTTSYLVQIALELGFRLELELVDVIRSRGLMTRRNASASVIETEAITVLRK